MEAPAPACTARARLSIIHLCCGGVECAHVQTHHSTRAICVLCTCVSCTRQELSPGRGTGGDRGPLCNVSSHVQMVWWLLWPPSRDRSAYHSPSSVRLCAPPLASRCRLFSCAPRMLGLRMSARRGWDKSIGFAVTGQFLYKSPLGLVVSGQAGQCMCLSSCEGVFLCVLKNCVAAMDCECVIFRLRACGRGTCACACFLA